jgi:hypothetical protein
MPSEIQLGLICFSFKLKKTISLFLIEFKRVAEPFIEVSGHFQRTCLQSKDEQVLLFCIAIQYCNTTVESEQYWSNTRNIWLSKTHALLMRAFWIWWQRKVK